MPLGSSSEAPVIRPGPMICRSLGLAGCLTSGDEVREAALLARDLAADLAAGLAVVLADGFIAGVTAELTAVLAGSRADLARAGPWRSGLRRPGARSAKVLNSPLYISDER